MSAAVVAALVCSLVPAGLRGETPAHDLTLPLEAWDPPPTSTRAAVVPGGPNGESCLRLVVSEVSWESQLRRALVYPRPIARVVFAGSYRAEGVAEGASPEGRVRAMLFFIGEGGRVGDWQPASKIAGTTAWQTFRQELAAPPGALGVRLMIGPTLTTGTAYFHGLRVTAFDDTGAVVEPLASPISRTDTSSWWEFAPGREDANRPLVLDPAAYRLPPAEQTGWVKASGERFVFEKTGAEVRFWGTNVTGASLFQGKDAAEALIERFARLGFNMIRLHHMDAPWTPNVFADGSTTQALDAGRMDALDRLIALARRQHMRVMLDLMVTRVFREGDGVRDWDKLGMGAKVACHFNRRIIDLHKAFTRAYLTHLNPYTGLRYADDPTIVLMDIVNESSLFWPEGHDALPASYQKELDALHAAWRARGGLAPPEQSVRVLLRQKDPQVFRFLKQTQDAHYREFEELLRAELGVKALITGSNHWETNVTDLTSNAAYDFIDRHKYWDHPTGGWSPTNEIQNIAMARRMDDDGSLVVANARRRVADRPLIVSEWNACWPNDAIGEAPLIMASYGAFQNWSGLLEYDFGLPAWAPTMTNPFEAGDKPQFIAGLPAAALAFRRGDVRVGEERRYRPSLAEQYGELGASVPGAVFLRERVAAVLPAEGQGQPLSLPEVAAGDVLRSSTAELTWKRDGLVTVNAPRTRAVVGFTRGRPVDLGDVAVVLANEFGQVAVTSLSDQPIASAPRLLLTASAKAENSGQAYQPMRMGLVELGRAPIRLEPVSGEVVLRRAAARAPRVYAVDWYGRRTSLTLPVKTDARAPNAWRIQLGAQPYYWFEVQWD